LHGIDEGIARLTSELAEPADLPLEKICAEQGPQ
jgi:hypothetical protein